MNRNIVLGALLLGLLGWSAMGWAEEQEPTDRPAGSANADAGTPQRKVSEEEIAAEFERLAGHWRPIEGSLAGNSLSPELCKSIKLELSAGAYQSTVNGVASSGKITLDLTSDPPAMDILVDAGPDDGKTIKCIYKWEDQKLHVAYSLDGSDARPKEFVSNQDNKLLVFIYEPIPQDEQPETRKAAAPKSGGR
jgi:uncharacterized protein (TIGR03067 family)